MTKSKYIRGARRLRVLGVAALIVTLCGLGIGSALAEKSGDTSLDDSAKEVGNNFGKLLKGMGEEVGKVIGTEDKAADKDKKKETKQTDDKSDKSKEEGSK